MAKKKEAYDSVFLTQNKMIEDFERRILEILEESNALKASNSSLQAQIDQCSNKISSQDLEIAKLKFEHKVLTDSLEQSEIKVKKLMQEKNTDVTMGYSELERKFKSLEQEVADANNVQLKADKKVLQAKIGNSAKCQCSSSNNTKKESLDCYQVQDLEAAQEPALGSLHAQTFLTPFALHLKPPLAPSNRKTQPSQNVSLPIKISDDDYEIKLLEIESKSGSKASLKAQLMQKDRQVIETSIQMRQIQADVRKKDERIFELENELITLKAKFTKSEKENEDNNLKEQLAKKQKLSNYDYIPKKVLNSPNKDELKKEIKYLESKNKNYEKKLEKSKVMEENCYKKIDELSKHNFKLESQLSANISIYDSIL